MPAERVPEMPDSKRFPIEAFTDILEANSEYAAAYRGSDLTGTAAQGLAIVTCMDSRIDPLRAVGMKPGDAKILRNAGARVTEDVHRTLILAVYLLGVTRILVMPHTGCRMVGSTESQIHAGIREEYGVDTRSIEFRTTAVVDEGLAQDVVRLRASPLLPRTVSVGGAVYDVKTGMLRPLQV